jgi:hypothetical protein
MRHRRAAPNSASQTPVRRAGKGGHRAHLPCPATQPGLCSAFVPFMGFATTDHSRNGTLRRYHTWPPVAGDSRPTPYISPRFRFRARGSASTSAHHSSPVGSCGCDHERRPTASQACSIATTSFAMLGRVESSRTKFGEVAVICPQSHFASRFIAGAAECAPTIGDYSLRQLFANAAIARRLVAVRGAGVSGGCARSPTSRGNPAPLQSIILAHFLTAFLDFLGFFFVHASEFIARIV